MPDWALFRKASHFRWSLPLTSSFISYAPWCPHCQSLAPVLKQASTMIDREAPGLTIGIIDATKEKKLAERFGIKSFPSLKL